MSERAQLLTMLHRLRRRVRLLAALDGAVRGGAAGLAAAALAFGVAHLRGGTARSAAAVAPVMAAAGIVGGALARALRRIPLLACARFVDRALDGQDRVLSALSFAGDRDPDAPFARAVLSDALARARVLAPAHVAPLGRPRGLPALAVAALAAVLVAALPARAPASRAVRAPARAAAASTPRLRVDPKRLDAEREEARRAAEAALTMGDERLGALARDLSAALRSLSDGTLTRGEALDRLQALMARAAEATSDAEQARQGLRAAGEALEDTPATRAAGAAMTADDAGATAQALEALAQRAGDGASGERGQIASAMEAAAGAAAASGGDEHAESAAGDNQRRLARDRNGENAAAANGATSPDSQRHLEHLRRDLADTASACRQDPDLCKRRLSDRAHDLPRMEREAQSSEARRRLQEAIRQMRERLRRGDLGDHKPRVAERHGGRSSERRPGQQGQRGAQGERGEGAISEGDGAGNGEGAEGELDESDGGDGAEMMVELDGEPPEGQPASSENGGPGQSAGAPASGAGAGASDSQGEGIGNGHSPQALGRPGSAPPTPEGRGHQVEQRLKGGAGPSRSQVIEAAAERGFAHGGYERVFNDYHAVVEEALSAGDVPEGRRYVVRRYFQLIRPRTSRTP